MNFGFAGFFLLAIFAVSISATNYIRGCYYTNWSQYRLGGWRFLPENIEPGLCTHIFYAFASMGDDFIITSVEKNDADLYARVNALKNNQTGLKTILSFGGYLFQQTNGPLMSQLLGSFVNRDIFIRSVIVYLRLFQFDGFDINWYPDADTKENFALLVKEFRDAIEAEAQQANVTALLLTAAVPPHIDMIAAGYDGQALASSLDWMNVNSFDYHGGWENQTGYNTPGFDPKGSVTGTLAYLNATLGISKDQLVVGFASYGRGWTLASTSSPNTVPSPAIGPSPPQPYTLADGFAAYFEICLLIQQDGYSQGYDPIQLEPYIYKNNVWIAYDNPTSYAGGLDWMIANGYTSAFVWSMDLDDFRGRCQSSNGTYPLIKTVQSKLTQQ